MITLTEEQKNIIKSLSTGDNLIKINAYAGSGKTTMVTELVKEIRKTDTDCGILYLVFNKTACEEAQNKFDSLGLNVECYTAHAFALKRINLYKWIEGQKEGKKNTSIKVISSIFGDEYLELRNSTPRYKYVSYAKVNDLFEGFAKTWDNLDLFCKNVLTGDHEYVLNYEPKDCDVEFFHEHYNKLLSMNMYTHGMYLKEYAINYKDIVKKYKYVFLDEAQDLNKFMLNIINRIHCDKKYIIGDTYQQIYQWNGAINALDQFDCITYPLSTSFRITDKECKIANHLLSRYAKFKESGVTINNINKKNLEYDNTKQTVIFRTNAMMFNYAVMFMIQGRNKVHFLDTYNGSSTDCFEDTFAVLLYMYKKLIDDKDELKRFNKLFKTKRTCKDIDTYIKLAEKEDLDFRTYLNYHMSTLPLNLQQYWKFFRENEVEIVDILVALKNSENMENPDKEFWLVTAHRSKGLEWDNVRIAEDKWKVCNDEEVNLLYVACTRAKKHLDYSAIEDLIELPEEEEELPTVEEVVTEEAPKDDESSSLENIDVETDSSKHTTSFFEDEENKAFWDSMVDITDIVDFEDLC